MVRLLASFWRERGDEVLVASGTERLPPADLAILHVNLSVIPDNYAEAARRYPRVVNGAALDIRKRTVSSNLVSRDDDWPGPVIVKTDLNYFGLPEAWACRQELSHGQEVPEAPPALKTYPVFRDIPSVPERIWSRPHLVVERFLPERDEKGFYLRTWVFLGDRERCRRHLSRDAVVKSKNLIASEDCGVPDFIRSERERLGFDYGKFDFVMHKGQPVLLDANKTPGSPPWNPQVATDYALIAQGIDSLLATPAPAPL